VPWRRYHAYLRWHAASDRARAFQQAYPECRGGDITHIFRDIRPRTGLGRFSRHIQSAVTHIFRDMRPRTGLGLFSRHIQSAVAAISRISDVKCGPGPGLRSSAGISRVPLRQYHANLRWHAASDWPWGLQQAYPECHAGLGLALGASAGITRCGVGDITHIVRYMRPRTGLGRFSRHIQSAVAAK
jgi:hypothetical protein